MKLVYFGSGEFGLPTLRALTQHHEVMAVVSQPDKPAGRSQKLTPTPIAAWADQHARGVVLLKPENVNEPRVVEEIRAFPVDAWVVIAFGQKLGRPLLDGRFAINLHASLLPRWRGAAPINHAVLAGDAVTGNSVITLADTMDAGLILGCSTRAIDPMITAGELHDLLSADGPSLVLDVLARHESGSLAPEQQDQRLVTKASKLKKSDGVLDLSMPAEACRRRVHGLTPWPGVSVRFRDEPLKLLRVEAIEGPAGQPRNPGAFVDAEAGIVACGSGTSLRLVEVQPPGGRAMPWADFARGRRVRADDAIVGGASC